MAQLDMLRVKRKRTDSAVATLYVDDKHRQQRKVSKRLKVSSYVYRLAETSEEAPPPDADGVYLESDESNKRKFRVVQQHQRGSVSGLAAPIQPRQQPEELSKEEDPTGMLSSMVESYLRVSGDSIKEPMRKRRHASMATGSDETPMDTSIDGDMDYVYDVYYREQASGGTAPSAGTANIGLIVVDSDDEKLFGLEDDEEDSDFVLTDDEDSNAEDFYKNDYPDEDYSSDFENAPDDDAGEEDAEWQLRQQLDKNLAVHNNDGHGTSQFLFDEDDYRDTYIGRTVSDSDDNDSFDSNSRKDHYERDYSSGDEDMEQYRDRIFGELQRQIEKRKNVNYQARQH